MRAALVVLATLALACGDFGEGIGDGDGSSSGGSGSSTGAPTTTAPPTTSTTTVSTSADSSTSSADDSTTADNSSSDASSSGSDDASSSGGENGCDIDPLAPDLYADIVLEHDGVMRSYNLYVPAGFTGDAALPLVLNFHGLLGSSAQQQSWSLFDPAAD
ncbi:MAG: hypothetical protein IAG13_05420, partial [Deltaproteobacteria bacterium]|nr:hypothetical protein [Nannocystaceae bacterium]